MLLLSWKSFVCIIRYSVAMLRMVNSSVSVALYDLSRHIVIPLGRGLLSHRDSFGTERPYYDIRITKLFLHFISEDYSLSQPYNQQRSDKSYSLLSSYKTMKTTITTLLLILLVNFSVFSQVLLVDYGLNAASNIYNTAIFPGWNNVSLSSTTHYTSSGGVSGTCMTSAQASPFSNYTCISGNPRNFVRGQRIFLTWYNSSSNPLDFNPLISFTDNNNPVNTAGQPLWFIVGKYDNYWIDPGQTLVTYYDITDATDAGEIFPMSQGTYSLLNVCVNTTEPGLILDKIEIGLADTVAPSVPQNLQISQTTSNSKRLSWSSANDNPGGDGMSHYDIFVNNLHFGVSQTNQFTAHLLESGKNYTFQVRAVDNNRNFSVLSNTVNGSTTAAGYGWHLFDPQEHITYKGAFRLPDGGVGSDFNYMDGDPAYYPDGNPTNTDAYPGSLFIAGDATHRYVAEISIPEPVISPATNLNDLNQATFLQNFANVVSPNVQYAAWGWKKGPALEYLPAQSGQTQGYLYTCFGEYYAWDGERFNSFGACNTTLSSPSPAGGWIIGPQGDGMQAPHYMTFISFLFASPYQINGHLLIAGGSRPGNLHNGPTLVAYSPWNDGTPLPGNNTLLSYTPLLMYDDDFGTNHLNGYSYCDYWYGGQWIRTGNRQSVVISGMKARGRAWYGYNNGESTFNVMMNVPTPDEPEDHGPRQSFAQAMLLFYNPQDLIDVATGIQNTWEPQPYAVLDLNDYFYYPNNYDPDYIYRYKGAGGMAYDRERGTLYVTERGVTGNDNTVAIVHVWQINHEASCEESASQDNIKVYYSQGYMNIISDEILKNATVQVFDISGKLMTLFEIKNSNCANFAFSASEGVYIVNLKTEKFVKTTKLIISKY